MTTSPLTMTALCLAIAAGVLVGCAADAPPPPPVAGTPIAATPAPAPAVTGSVRQMTARIESVDQTSRAVLLRLPGNRLSTVIAGPQVQNLAQIRAGDSVTVRYMTAVAARVAPAGSPPPPAAALAAALAAARAEPGERPAGFVGEAVATRVNFLAFDRRTNTATFRLGNGRIVTTEVQQPEMRAFAGRLRRGQQVDLAYSEAVAVTVTPMPARR